MGIAKVTRNFQVTIPKDVRSVEEIRIGDTLLFSIEGARIEILKKSRKDILKESAGVWKGAERGYKWIRRLRVESEGRRKRLGL